MAGMEITDSTIYNYASNPTVYKRGISYFNQGRVFDLMYDEYNSTVYASVEGNDDFYDASITFFKNGHIESSHCECPAFENYSGACKHIIAVLKEAQRNLRYKRYPVSEDTNSMNQVFSYYNNLIDEELKDVCALEITLHIEKEANKLFNYIQLRIGVERLYIVKDIKEFLIAFKRYKPVEFGKNFTFDPSILGFSENDRPFIDILMELVENEEMLTSINSPFSDLSSVFKGKKVYLSDPYVKRFFNNINNKSINVVIFGMEYNKVNLLDCDLPLTLTLKENNERIDLGIENNQKIIPLNNKGNYFFYENAIYHTSATQSKSLVPFINAFASNKKTFISISKADLGRFVSEVLPVIKRAAKVHIDDSLKDNFIKEALNTKIFFDKYLHGISSIIEFNYGDKTVIPFSPNSPSSTHDKILIRDSEEERKVLHFFEKYDFKVEKGKIYLLDENMVFEFMYNALPALHDLAEIYYSEGFKSVNIVNKFSFSGGVKLTGNSLLEFTFDFDGFDVDELALILENIKEKKKYYRLKNGSFIPLDNHELNSMAYLLEKLDIREEDLNNKIINLPNFRAIYLDTLLRESKLNFIERNLSFKQMVQNIKEPQDMDFKVPSPLKNVLRDYQKTGFKWLKTLSSYGFGGILADDMGLGKTLQIITFILSERMNSSKPSLVIAPTSLVYNWQDEVIKFMPSLKVSVISGIQKDRLEQFKEITEADIVITSYSLIRRDIDMYSKYEFSYCILDEAQHIKNPKTINAKSVKQIKAKGYFALTGTPIENSLTELWSIFDFIMPGYLLSHSQFVQKFETPIIKTDDQEALKDLSNHIRPFILRRMKKDVLKELPEKIEGKMICEMTEEQNKTYIAYLNKAKSEVAAELASRGFEKSQIKILSILTRLRQICCHPSLFIENYSGDSGKMSLLMEILEDGIDAGHRILIFSQFTSMLQIIGNELASQNIEYFYLDGSTKSENRIEMVKAFNNGEREVFLLSLKAGGTGLNLTGADMVIHFDPWWNPSVEDQASDRAYRIGQNNVVQVIKLLSKGTIEEKIFELQQKKRAMIDSVIKPGETLLSKMTESEILGLFEE